MSKPYVLREDIVLEEEREMAFTRGGYKEMTAAWVATLDGRLSTGERVSISRTSLHLGEASLLLEEAIKAEGWLIK